MTWDYRALKPGEVFQIGRYTNGMSWTVQYLAPGYVSVSRPMMFDRIEVITNTTDRTFTFPIDPDRMSCLYTVRVKDLNTGLTSLWCSN